MNESLLPLLAIIIPVYWMWRTHIATNARIKLLKEINNFLDPENNNHEMTQEIVYNAYEDSKNHFFILEMLYYTFFRIEPAQFKASKDAFKKLPAEQRKKMTELVVKLMLTNIKLSPVTYFIVGLNFLLLALVMTLRNHLSPSKLKRNIQNLKEKTLYSIYSF